MNLPKHIEVLDAMLNDALREQVIETVHWMPVHFLNRSTRFETHELDMHWYYPLAVSDNVRDVDVEPQLQTWDESLDSIRQLWELLKTHLNRPVRLYELMLGADAFGTEGKPHFDLYDPLYRQAHITILVYCNREWKLEWAGETLFFDAAEEVNAAIRPRPGRVVIATGDPRHVGRSVSRICPTDRRVLVFKLWDVALLNQVKATIT